MPRITFPLQGVAAGLQGSAERHWDADGNEDRGTRSGQEAYVYVMPRPISTMSWGGSRIQLPRVFPNAYCTAKTSDKAACQLSRAGQGRRIPEKGIMGCHGLLPADFPIRTSFKTHE